MVGYPHVPLAGWIWHLVDQVAGRSQGQFPHASQHEYVRHIIGAKKVLSTLLWEKGGRLIMMDLSVLLIMVQSELLQWPSSVPDVLGTSGCRWQWARCKQTRPRCPPESRYPRPCRENSVGQVRPASNHLRTESRPAWRSVGGPASAGTDRQTSWWLEKRSKRG